MVVKRIDVQNTTLTLDELLSELDADTDIILLRGDIPLARISIIQAKADEGSQARVMGLHEGQG